LCLSDQGFGNVFGTSPGHVSSARKRASELDTEIEHVGLSGCSAR